MIARGPQLHGFYRVPERELYGHIHFKVATNEQLDARIADGIELINILYPPPPSKTFLQVAMPVVMIAVAMMTAGAAIAALSGGGAAVGGAASTIASTAAAAGGTATTASVMATIQHVATVINSAVTIRQVTGHDVPDTLAKVSSIFSGNVTKNVVNAGIGKGFEYILERQNQKIDKKNKQANDALRERIERARVEYASYLKAIADEEARRRNLVPPSERPENVKAPTQKPGVLEIISVLTPFILYSIG